MKQNLPHSVWKCCALSFLVILSSYRSFSQLNESASYFDAGVTIGPSNFLGDLGGNMGKGTTFLKDNNMQMTKMTIGAFLGYHPNELFAARLAINIGSLEGDDAIINPKGGLEEARKIRNSNFKSKFTEFLLLAEVYPTVFIEADPSDTYKKFRPYVLAGIGGFKYNPLGYDDVTGNWVALQPLRTEGQGFAEYPDRKEYKLTQMNLPIGVGLKYFLNDGIDISFEIIHRKTFTDYIDDVSTDYVDPALFYNYMPLAQAQLAERMANKSQGRFEAGDKRGTPKNNDAYYSAGFKIAFRLGNDNRYSNSTSCPVRF
jgi:hypothetical protein